VALAGQWDYAGVPAWFDVDIAPQSSSEGAGWFDVDLLGDVPDCLAGEWDYAAVPDAWFDVDAADQQVGWVDVDYLTFYPRPLSVAFAGLGSAAFTEHVAKSLALAIVGAGSTTFAEHIAKSLVLAVTGASSATFAKHVAKSLVLTVAGVGSATFAEHVHKSLVLGVVGVSSATFIEHVAKSLALGIVGSSSAVFTEHVHKSLALAVAGQGSMAEALTVHRAFVLSVSGAGVVTLAFVGSAANVPPLFLVPFAIDQNEDKTVLAGFFDGTASATLAPFTFAGCSAKMEIRLSQDPNSELLLSLTTGGGGLVLDGPTDLYNGAISCATIQWTITHAQSAALPPGTYYYDLLVTTPSGSQSYCLWGDFSVRGTGTR
jgi:hypothetical protein